MIFKKYTFLSDTIAEAREKRSSKVNVIFSVLVVSMRERAFKKLLFA